MSIPSTIEIEYPTSDGKPMAETDFHRKLMTDTIEALEAYFADRPDVYVSGNMLVYYMEGEPRRHRAPDAFVVFGVPKHEREVFKTWIEGKAPDVVIEITSKTTMSEDVNEKLWVYRDDWKVREYFMFDPREEYLKPSMQGFRLIDDEYVMIEPQFGQLHSEVLGLRLERQGKHLVFRNPVTGREVLPQDQENLRQAELREELRAAHAAALEAEISMIQMEKQEEQRLRAEAIVEKEKEQRLLAEVRAEIEREQKLRADAQAEVERLRRELESLRNPPSTASE